MKCLYMTMEIIGTVYIDEEEIVTVNEEEKPLGEYCLEDFIYKYNQLYLVSSYIKSSNTEEYAKVQIIDKNFENEIKEEAIKTFHFYELSLGMKSSFNRQLKEPNREILVFI